MSDFRLSPGFVRLDTEKLPHGWTLGQIGSLCSINQGGKLGLTKETHYVSSGVPAYSAAGQDGFVNIAEYNSISGVVLSAIGANCGRCFFADGDWTTLANTQAIIPREKLDAKYLFYRVNREEYWTRSGSAQPFIKPTSIKSSWIAYPSSLYEQKKISTILSCVDKAIEKTEALIAKYRQIKAGLMHDLFTRGITADGKLRPPREQAPELYKETPIGWIPKGWDISNIGTLIESLVDGPFGSNLKTEHYVVDPGVRVVRLQNIQATNYNDGDRAFIPERHANFLVRNKVIAGDILIAGLGEERYPVGRACLYPDDLPPAINKADCFRMRCNNLLAVNSFVMNYLNTETARRQVTKYEQGVTRPRINLGNLKKVLVPQPDIVEQQNVSDILLTIAKQIDIESAKRVKLLDQKQGLMHDLLTGRVRIPESPNIDQTLRASC